MSALSAFRKTKDAKPVAATTHESPTSQPATEQGRPFSAIVAPVDLPALTKKADLIVVGRVDSVKNLDLITGNVEGRAMQAQRMVASLNVDRVIKGSAETTRLSFDFLMPRTQSSYRDIRTSEMGMFFLRKNGERDFEILDPHYPFVIASSTAVATDADDLDRVVRVVGSKLTDPASSVSDRRAVVNVLTSARTDLSDNILRQAAKDNDAVVRLQALSALLSRGDVSMLAEAERLLLRRPANTDDYLLANLSSALEGIRDPQALPTLKRLLKSTDRNTRLSAALALRQMRTADAIEGLSAALDDSDRDVRYQAVIGLAEFTRQDSWAPSISLFRQDEKPYLVHWKAWVQTQTAPKHPGRNG